MGVIFPLYYKSWMVWNCMNEYIQFTNKKVSVFETLSIDLIIFYNIPSNWFELFS